MKSQSTYVTKPQLIADYVTKREFGEFRSDMSDFREEMHDFREETRIRFDAVDARFNTVDARLSSIDGRLNGHDKRFDSIERKIDAMREETRISMGAWRDQLRSDFLAGIEYMKDIAAGKKDLRDNVFE